MRKNEGKPFVAKTKADLSPFKKADLKNMQYVTDYGSRHSNAPKRAKEFHAARSQHVLQASYNMIDEADKDYKENKAWKAANPDYVYPGGTGDRK
jgi:hypothetical protein